MKKEHFLVLLAAELVNHGYKYSTKELELIIDISIELGMKPPFRGEIVIIDKDRKISIDEVFGAFRWGK